MKYLLEVNVILAMRYEKHVHHARVHFWLMQLRAIYAESLKLATSPITELAFVRIACGPVAFAGDVATAQADLESLISHGRSGHSFRRRDCSWKRIQRRFRT